MEGTESTLCEGVGSQRVRVDKGGGLGSEVGRFGRNEGERNRDDGKRWGGAHRDRRACASLRPNSSVQLDLRMIFTLRS